MDKKQQFSNWVQDTQLNGNATLIDIVKFDEKQNKGKVIVQLSDQEFKEQEYQKPQ